MLASVSTHIGRHASWSGRLSEQKNISGWPWFLPKFLVPSGALGSSSDTADSISHHGAALSGYQQLRLNIHGYVCF